MSVHTRTHHTRESIRHVHEKEGEKWVPWREAMEIDPEAEAGMVLRGSRYKEGMTQKVLAEMLGILPHHVSEMEHGKRPIGKKLAHRLAKIFNINYRVFL